MNRRGFLGAMLGAMAAPAVVKAEHLMKIFVPPEKKIITLSTLAGDFDGDVINSFHYMVPRDPKMWLQVNDLVTKIESRSATIVEIPDYFTLRTQRQIGRTYKG